jgi:hypothetical protein
MMKTLPAWKSRESVARGRQSLGEERLNEKLITKLKNHCQLLLIDINTEIQEMLVKEED